MKRTAALLLGLFPGVRADIVATYDFADGSAASSDPSVVSLTSDYDPRSAAIGGDDSAVSSSTFTAYMRADNTPATLDPATSNYYHRFSLTVQNLAPGQALDLNSLDFDYRATNIEGTFSVGLYSSKTGFVSPADELGTAAITTSGTDHPFSIDLTSANPAAGSALTGLSNGEMIEFRIHFADTSGNNASIHRIDNLVLSGVVSSPTDRIANGGFEATPFDLGWDNAGATLGAGLNGSPNAARLGYGSTATLGQATGPLVDFVLDAYVEVAGSSTPDSFHLFLDGDGGTAVEISGGPGNILRLSSGSIASPVSSLADGSPFGFPGDTTVGDDAIRLRVFGHHFGTPWARYDLAWSEPGSTALSHAANGLTAFVNAGAATVGSGLTGVRFDRSGTSGHSYWVDDVSLFSGTDTVPPADFGFIEPSDEKVVRISGVYPHLAMTNDSNECGPGAVVPWADRLWCVTYSPHEPNGSSSKLYEIDAALNRIIRPESLGGTPANRFIHTPSNQLIIGPHFIDASRNVRNLPYTVARGRHTGVAAHLSDPDNRVYLMTMENGVYDVNVNDLSVIVRYPDVQGRGDRFLHGYHGKGLYSGQGLLVAANNGRPNNQDFPTGEAGVLATWDGTTVADNGGSYLVTNDPNTGIGDNTGAPVAPQSDYIAGWDQIAKVQTCEVTGPGGIYGNPNPASDPIWTTGFDAKSVILRTLESGVWHTWRLPKGSYTHDGSHGWHTEWPRIRQLDPENDPASPYLMHMHGLFFDFPPTFSATDFSGLTPICGYYKMPVDYCTFNGELVIAKNDASKFSNALAPKAQSNFWWGQLSDLAHWGAPTGHGAVWMNEAVSHGQSSDPFLTSGFAQGTLHLRNNGAPPVSLVLQTTDGSGSGSWTDRRILNAPANGYLHEDIADLGAAWIRLRADGPASDLTAFFHLSNPYPHAPIASLGTDRFAALADIRDTGGLSDGIVRVMAGDELALEFASDSGYHRIGGPMLLEDVADASAEADLRSAGALVQEWGSDAASAWIDDGGTRFRLPKLDPLYDAPFLSGWARGEREAVTERKLLNLHGTFYEVPRDNSGGKRKMRALATHGKRITDFASWRGLFVLTGVLDHAPESDALVRNSSGEAALWLGETDDLWQMGEPRGIGGPWLDTPVSAGSPSDPYLMYGYDRKSLELSHDSDSLVTFTVEVDFLADDTWSVYGTFPVAPGETLSHLFPTGFHAHWVRVTSDTATSATAQFTYGPADQRDRLLDWARTEGLPTGVGRRAVAAANDDGDELDELAEFVLGTDPHTANSWPIETTGQGVRVVVRDLLPSDGIRVAFETTTGLVSWETHPELVGPDPDQSGVPTGFTRFRYPFQPGVEPRRFVRLRIELGN